MMSAAIPAMHRSVCASSSVTCRTVML